MTVIIFVFHLLSDCSEREEVFIFNILMSLVVRTLQTRLFSNSLHHWASCQLVLESQILKTAVVTATLLVPAAN